MSSEKRIDGQNVLYHYIQKNLLKEDNALSQELLKRFLLDMSIWIPPSFYRRLPIMLPYVVRDAYCRGKLNGGKEEWGTADKEGFLRDDNSLIKGIPRSFVVENSQLEYYNGFKMGNGFVASHLWDKVTINGNQYFSSRRPELNSFVPNITWLPVQLSKFTNHSGSFAQRFLQAVSYKIYRTFPMPETISKIWENLEFPKEFNGLEIDLSKISFFKVSDGWLDQRIKNLIHEIDVIIAATERNSKNAKVKCHRYLPSLVKLSKSQRKAINEWLVEYRSFIKAD